jgi:hypothetical protein
MHIPDSSGSTVAVSALDILLLLANELLGWWLFLVVGVVKRGDSASRDMLATLRTDGGLTTCWIYM